MERREFIRNTVGALFGVSVIPAALQKPKPWPPILSNVDFICESRKFAEHFHGRQSVKAWWTTNLQAGTFPQNMGNTTKTV